MGGEVIMNLKGNGASKLKKLLSKHKQNNYSFIGPQCAHREGYKPDCWINFEGKSRVEVGYCSSFGNSDWAQAMAISIYNRFPINKGGWDSVGYCKDITQFTKSIPFGVSIKIAKRNLKEVRKLKATKEITQKVIDDAINLYEAEIKEYKKYSKEYLKLAETIFKGIEA